MSTNPFESPDSALPTTESMNLLSVMFSFEGRIPRRTYWAYSLISLALLYASVAFVSFLPEGPLEDIGLLGFLVVVLLYIITNLAVSVKRWHDRGYSGLMVLIGIIPIIGPIWSFVELGLLPGDPGRNSFGEEPT